MAARPLVLPEPFNGEGRWEEWAYHFESVADVNGWDAAQKLKWLKVRLTGRAQIAFQRLSEETRADFKEAKKALTERFEPKSRKSRYQAEFQTRRKKKTEAWADFAEDLKQLADHAFPDLEDKARERLALNVYLQNLEHPQVAFSVRQKCPETLDAAVSATLEIETYLPPKGCGLGVSGVEVADETTVAAVNPQEKLVTLVEKLVERVEKLEQGRAPTNERPTAERKRPWDVNAARTHSQRSAESTVARGSERARTPVASRSAGFDGLCWRCGKRGHVARNCRLGRQPQGN